MKVNCTSFLAPHIDATLKLANTQHNLIHLDTFLLLVYIIYRFGMKEYLEKLVCVTGLREKNILVHASAVSVYHLRARGGSLLMTIDYL